MCVIKYLSLFACITPLYLLSYYLRGDFMGTSHLDFSFVMEGIDRQVLLQEVADRLDALRGALGTEQKASESPEGAFIRAFLQDNVEFAHSPIIEHITDAGFLQHNMVVPIRFKEMRKRCNFYWVEPTMILFPRRNWKFHQLEVVIEFNPDSPENELRPTAYRILPDKKFQTQLLIEGHLNIGLDENFEFQAQTGPVDMSMGPIGGKLNVRMGAKTAGNLELTAGPFIYHIKRVQIDHTAIGAQKIFWRLNGTEFFQENTPRLVVIVRVPQEVKVLKIAAAMQAYHSMRFPSNVQEALKELPTIFQNFFKGGIPIFAETMWDVSSRL